jgi:hypothetical protein
VGFWSYIGGILLSAVAILIAIFGIVVLLGFLNSYITSYNVPLGIILIIIALFVFAYGWYSYESAKPKGTLNVHNQ